MVYMSELLIVGCGGLGRMVGEVALATGKWSGVRFLDDAARGRKLPLCRPAAQIAPC